MRTKLRNVATSLLLLLAGACGLEPTPVPQPSWVRASLTGSVTATFEGTGYFAPLRDYLESPRYLKIMSSPFESSDGSSLYFRSNTAARPGPGTYRIVPHETIYGSTRGWTAVYAFPMPADSSRLPGDLYVAQAGTITITKSTSQVLEGTFRFTGVRVNQSARARYNPDPNAPTAEITGSFRVNFLDEDTLVAYPS